MNDIPNATELLAIARSTLLDKLLPRVPEELRYDALMIANAMAIAAREHAPGDDAAHAELARLAALLAEHHKPCAGAELISARADLNRRLAAQIRAGRFDDKDRAALLDHLAQTAADELAVSNPRALEA
jgi:MoxR-like ATPase